MKMPGVARRSINFLTEVIDELDDFIRDLQTEIDQLLQRIEVNRIYLARPYIPLFMKEQRENAIMASQVRIWNLQDRIVVANIRQNELREEIRLFYLNNPSRQ